MHSDHSAVQYLILQLKDSASEDVLEFCRGQLAVTTGGGVAGWRGGEESLAQSRVNGGLLSAAQLPVEKALFTVSPGGRRMSLIFTCSKYNNPANILPCRHRKWAESS